MIVALREVWRNPYVRVAVGLAAAVGLYLFLSWSRALWGTFLIAWLIAFLLHPVMVWFERRGLGRWTGLAAVLAVVLGIAALLWWLGINLVSQLSLIIAELPALLETVAELPFIVARAIDPSYGDTFQSAFGNLEQLLERARTQLLPSLEGAREDLLGRLLAGGGAGLQVTAIVVLSFLFLMGFRRYSRAFLRAVPGRHRPAVTSLVRQLGYAVGGYVRGQLIIASAVGLVTGIGLALIGVPLAAGLGLLTAVGNLIPFVGPLLAAVPALALAWLDGTVAVVATAALLMLVQVLDGNVLTPLVFSRLIEVDAVTVIAAIVIGGFLFGFWGIVAAVPVAVFLTILYREHYLTSRWYRGGNGEEASG